ncbi:hypothetical protein KEM54_003979 [Ascosphaera aggregata]|nr:hypothetical protein KEM54_003979 [Ascosphaera aggregata]
MPSPRRLRALLLATVLALGFTFYLTSEMHHNGGGNFYRQTVNAMSSKQQPQPLQRPHDSSPVDGGKDASPQVDEAQETFRKLKPSASEQDKQAIAPDRQFQIEKERKKEKQKQVEGNQDTEGDGDDKEAEEDADNRGNKPAKGKGKISTDSEVIDTTSGNDKSTKGSKAGEKGKIDDEDDEDSEDADKKSVSKGDKSSTPVKGEKPQKDDGKKKTTADTTDPEVDTEFQAILKRSPVIVFSKTYCPFSKKAKHILGKYTIVPGPHIVELDEHPLGTKLQVLLGDMTGRTTVPNILINGKSLGGGDDVEALHQKRTLAGTIQTMAGKRVIEVSPKKGDVAGDDAL